MAKPPPDADPEDYIIGEGWYDNLTLARPYCDGRTFRIDPYPVPWFGITMLNVVFVLFFGGVYVGVSYLTGDWSHLGLLGLCVVIGGMTCGGVSGIYIYRYRRANRLGPWLILDRTTGRIELPREGITFERSDVLHVQYITTKHLGLGDHGDEMRVSELNLITLRDGVRERWPLLQSGATVRAFSKVLRAIQHHTDLPVMRVRDGWWSWEVTRTPYREL